MPYTDVDSLNIFLSFASEDVNIAIAIAATLRKAFPREVEITAMNESPFGESWRKLIDDSIDKTDVLIVIATGRLKPSHSFTGQEVGSFSFSMRDKPKISKCDLDRRIIPFAVLASVPDTINEFEGITIDRSSLRDLRFDASLVENDLIKDSTRKIDDEDRMYLFLSDLEDIITQRIATIRQSSTTKIERTITLGRRIDDLKDLASELKIDVLRVMLDRVESTEEPKASLVVRLRRGVNEKIPTDWLSGSSIRFNGNVSEIFGPRANDTLYTWEQLTKNIDNDVVYQWGRAFNALLSNTTKNGFLDDNSILSFNKSKIFRIFISQIVHYYNNDSEIAIYMVELLRRKDYGDPDTTLLLHALEISLSYRFMFLEGGKSQYSPTYFKYVQLPNFKEHVSGMLDGLNIILFLSDIYGLSDPKNIQRILGLTVADSMSERYEYWNKEKDAIYAAAKAIIGSKIVSGTDRDMFIQSLSDFCDHTSEINKGYITAVTGALNGAIQNTNTDG